MSKNSGVLPEWICLNCGNVQRGPSIPYRAALRALREGKIDPRFFGVACEKCGYPGFRELTYKRGGHLGERRAIHADTYARPVSSDVPLDTDDAKSHISPKEGVER